MIETPKIDLTLMGTSDLHMHIWPYDYFADKAAPTLGLGALSSQIEARRRKATNSMLFDLGDILQGNPMGDLCARQANLADHPMISAMNACGYDAATPGNHDFDYGIPFLEHALAQANFPYTSANLIDANSQDPWMPPYLLLKRSFTCRAGADHDLAVAVIGALPPQTALWDKTHMSGKLHVSDIVASVQDRLKAVKKLGADLAVVLAHSGIDASQTQPGAENASFALAQLTGIDALFTGHSHQVCPGPDFRELHDENGRIAGTPTVMPGFAGSHLGVIELELEGRDGRWRVSNATAEAVPCRAATSDLSVRIQSLTKADHENTLASLREPVGHTNVPLHSYFPFVAAAPSVLIVAEAQLWDVKQRLAETAFNDLPLLSAAAPFKAGGRGGPNYFSDVPSGPITLRNVADLYLYPNALTVLKLTGAMLKTWLEFAASAYCQIQPGQSDQQLLNPEFASYNCDTILGVTYQIDLTKPPGFSAHGASRAKAERIVNLAYQGQPVDAGETFLVVTNDYRASASGAFPGADDGEVVLAGPDTNQEILLRFIRERKITKLPNSPWSLCPIRQASARFTSGIGSRSIAKTYLGLTHVGTAEDGSEDYRLDLQFGASPPT